jgi:hypothetical protein
VIAWHEYTRNYRRKHWDDHTAANGIAVDWSDRDGPSRKSATRLLTDPHRGVFGCGVSRSVADYEAYAGISFVHRRTQDYTRAHLEPPNPPLTDDWATAVRDHTISVAVARAELTSDACRDTQFWYVGFHDGDGEELFRADADREEIDRLLEDAAPLITVVRQFESARPPTRWSLMPYSAGSGWLEAIGGDLSSDDGGHWHGMTTAALAALEHSGQMVSLTRDADHSSWYPRAVPNLEWTETERGFLVTHTGKASGLIANHTGVLVLELANGRRSVAEIADVVADAFGLADPPHADVGTFIDIASIRALVEIGTGERNAHDRTP